MSHGRKRSRANLKSYSPEAPTAARHSPPPKNLSANAGDSVVPVVLASGSDVYVIWADDTFGNFEIVFKKSTDGGANFGGLVKITNDAARSYDPHAVLSGGLLHVVWESGVVGEADILFSRSADGGASFSSPINLSNNSGDSFSSNLAVSGTRVYAAWTDDTPGNNEIMLSRSLDNGASFDSPVNITNNSGSSFLPKMAADGLNLYLAWPDDTPGNFEILFSKSTDGSSIFSTPVNLSNTSTLSYSPSILANSNRIHVSWYDASPSDIFFRSSFDGGTRFDVAINLSNNSGNSYVPEIVAVDSTVYAVWEDYSTGLGEILFLQFTIPGANADQLTLSDSITRVYSASRSLGETATLSEAIPEHLTRSTSDTVAVTSSIAAEKTPGSSGGSSNNPPTANAGPDQTVDEGALVSLDGTASSDPDNDLLTFTWTQTAGPSVTLSNPNAASPTFTAPTISSTTQLAFQLVVNDGTVDSSPDLVNVTVNDRKGTLIIRKVVQGTTQLLAGAQFTITPNPFTLTSSLVVQDGIPEDADPANGVIQLNNVEFGTFTIEETQVPAGFARVVRTLTVSVHSTQTSPTTTFENIEEAQAVQQEVSIPPPDLTSTEFNNFVLKGAAINNVPVQSVSDLPAARLVPPTQVTTITPISFTTAAPANSSIQNLRSTFTIPTYPSPEQTLAKNNVFIVPPVVIPQQNSANKFVMTPVLEKTVAGNTLLVDSRTPTASGSAQLQSVEMTFTDAGSVSNAAFSFGITDTVPPDTPSPPTSILETAALFLTVDFAGDFAGTDFSSTSAFQGSPKVRVLVDRDTDVDKLSDGCPDVSLYLFSEVQNKWITVKKPLRVPSIDTSESCGYEAEPEHWSKFAIGGVKIAANVLQSIPSSTSVLVQNSPAASVASGDNISASVSAGGQRIELTFAKVEEEGTVKLKASTPLQMSKLFSKVSASAGRFAIASSEGEIPYSTFGSIYDVDASAVKFTGPVEIAVPYNPLLLQPVPNESDLRLVHYTGSGWEDVTSSVDTKAGIIKGTLHSLSPVATAIIDDRTFDSSYFSSNPLKKVSIASAMNQSGGGTVSISATIKNTQKVSQDYVAIVQVLDSTGITKQIYMSTGSLARGLAKDISRNFVLDPGIYTVEILVWNSADSSPWPLAEKLQRDLML